MLPFSEPQLSPLPLSYFQSKKEDDPLTPKTDWKLTLAYVDNGTDLSKRHSVKVEPNQWNDDGWANGFMVGQITFISKANPTNKELNNGSQIFPIILWLDENYEEQK